MNPRGRSAGVAKMGGRMGGVKRKRADFLGEIGPVVEDLRANCLPSWRQRMR